MSEPLFEYVILAKTIFFFQELFLQISFMGFLANLFIHIIHKIAKATHQK